MYISYLPQLGSFDISAASSSTGFPGFVVQIQSTVYTTGTNGIMVAVSRSGLWVDRSKLADRDDLSRFIITAYDSDPLIPSVNANLNQPVK